MKKLSFYLSLGAISLSFSSCCSMFGGLSLNNYGYFRTEERQVKACGYDLVTEEVPMPGDSKSGKGGMTQVMEKKVPRYKTVTKRTWVRNQCVRYYCPKKDACGTTSDSIKNLASAQGWSGSPNIGLIPTMKPLAP